MAFLSCRGGLGGGAERGSPRGSCRPPRGRTSPWLSVPAPKWASPSSFWWPVAVGMVERSIQCLGHTTQTRTVEPHLGSMQSGGVTRSGLQGPRRRGPLALTGVAGWCPLLMGSWTGVAGWRSQLPRDVVASRQTDPVHGPSTRTQHTDPAHSAGHFQSRSPEKPGGACKSVTPPRSRPGPGQWRERSWVRLPGARSECPLALLCLGLTEVSGAQLPGRTRRCDSSPCPRRRGRSEAPCPLHGLRLLEPEGWADGPAARSPEQACKMYDPGPCSGSSGGVQAAV